MISRTFLNIIFIIIASSALVSCSSSKDEGTQNANSAQQAYEQSEKALKANGVIFSTSDGDGPIKVVLSFKELNSKVHNASTTSDKIKYLREALQAMEDFKVKSLILIEKRISRGKVHNTLVSKRNLVINRTQLLQDLIQSNEKDLAAEIILEAQRANNPYQIKIGSMSFYLCDLDYENPNISYGRDQVLQVKYDLKLAQTLLCTSQDVLTEANSKLTAYPQNKISIEAERAINLHVEPEKDSWSRRLFEIPKNRDELKTENLTTVRDYERGDGNLLPSNLIVKIPFLEVLYIVDKSQADSRGFINFLSRKIINDNDLASMSFLERNYKHKDEILNIFQSDKIKNLLNSKFEKAITKTTDEIIQFIIADDYDSLRRFSKPSNINKISYNKNIKFKSTITAYGFSPLMVAALLEDIGALDILLAIDGIDSNLESPIFKRNYITIKDINLKTIVHLQKYGGSGTSLTNGPSSGVTVRGGITFPQNPPNKYEGYTTLMIAVAENQCEIVDSIIEAESEALNYKTSKGSTALSISLGRDDQCLTNLLKAGAFDIKLFTEDYIHFLSMAVERVDGVESILDFIKYVDKSNFQSEDVQKILPEILFVEALPLELKVELHKKAPITLSRVRLWISKRNLVEIRSYRVRVFSRSYGTRAFVSLDFKFLNHIGFNLNEEKVFGRNKDQNLFNSILTRIHNHHSGQNLATGIESVLSGLLTTISEANPKWATEWVNSPNSFKGQNPLVAASMFNEVGIIKALLKIDGVDVNIVDAKTGYNALEWQYVVNPFMWSFTYSKIASALSDKGGAVRPEIANLIGKPNRASKTDMESKLKNASYLFGNKSETTKVPE